jgi:hypothetical protein
MVEVRSLQTCLLTLLVEPEMLQGLVEMALEEP